MKTLREHIDDLDRMIDSGLPPKHEIRSQIAFIAREVAALEADYEELGKAHTNLQEAKAEVDRQLSDTKARDEKAMDDSLTQKLKQTAESRRRRTLHYDP